MLQYAVVAVIVLVAALYAASKYLPEAWRKRIVYVLTRRGASDKSVLVKWFDTGSSCGSGCDSCKACDDEPAPPAEGKHRVIKIRAK